VHITELANSYLIKAFNSETYKAIKLLNKYGRFPERSCPRWM